jgi:type VI secretion system protein ImpJ
MSDSVRVHWCEGLFLQPQHLQLAERLAHDARAADRRLAMGFDYGVVEWGVAAESLANKIVRFDKLRVILPGGYDVHVGVNAPLEPLNIAEAFDASKGSLTVWLGLPRFDIARPNVVDAPQASQRRMYRLDNVECRDDATGADPQPVQVRQYNPQLVLDGQPRSDLLALPILRVVRGTGTNLNQPVADPSFAPACLVTSGFRDLQAIVERVAEGCEASRLQLATELSRAAFHAERIQPMQIVPLVKLGVLARYAARVRTIARTPMLRPVEAFIELRSLLHELAALRADQPFEASPDYDHDDPMTRFAQLEARIKPLLAGSVEATWRQIEFKQQGPILYAALNDAEVTDPYDLYLAIDSTLDVRELGTIVTDRERFKVMAPSRGMRPDPGIVLREERAPMGLPVLPTRYFFKFEPNDNDLSKAEWQRICAEKGIAVRWPNWPVNVLQKKDMLPTLYTMPRGGRKST